MSHLISGPVHLDRDGIGCAGNRAAEVGELESRIGGSRNDHGRAAVEVTSGCDSSPGLRIRGGCQPELRYQAPHDVVAEIRHEDAAGTVGRDSTEKVELCGSE